jgi:hypothetical protein
VTLVSTSISSASSAYPPSFQLVVVFILVLLVLLIADDRLDVAAAVDQVTQDLGVDHLHTQANV